MQKSKDYIDAYHYQWIFSERHTTLRTLNKSIETPLLKSPLWTLLTNRLISTQLCKKELLDIDDKTGVGTLAAAYANRGIIKDRNKNYQGALQDYIKALGIDDEAVAGPGLGTIILNYKFKSSSVKERALYLNEQLQLPEEERVLSIEELDAGQVMHKPGKL